eukprot:6497680-Pyramimonas_sp.AAC.1
MLQVCDRGATARDTVDGDLTRRVLACSPDGKTNRFSERGVKGCGINTSVPGVYTIVFEVFNSAGMKSVALTRQ